MDKDKIKQILVTVFEIGMLVTLLETIGTGGIGVLLGATYALISKVIIAFGVSVMGISGIGLSIYLPTQRFVLLRDAQVSLLAYVSGLGFLQILGLFIVKQLGVAGAAGLAAAGTHSIMITVVLTMFAMASLYVPFNYFKNLFSVLKANQSRDPRRLIKPFFK